MLYKHGRKHELIFPSLGYQSSESLLHLPDPFSDRNNTGKRCTSTSIVNIPIEVAVIYKSNYRRLKLAELHAIAHSCYQHRLQLSDGKGTVMAVVHYCIKEAFSSHPRILKYSSALSSRFTAADQFRRSAGRNHDQSCDPRLK